MVYARRDLDFWVARLHGRRSRLAEGARLHQLCRLRTVSELARNLLPDHAIYTAPALQRRIISDLANELAALAHAVPFPLVEWQGTLAAKHPTLGTRRLGRFAAEPIQTFLVEVRRQVSRVFSNTESKPLRGKLLDTFAPRSCHTRRTSSSPPLTPLRVPSSLKVLWTKAI